MTYDWFNLFNLDVWLATGRVSRSLVVNLETYGRTTFEIFQGNETSIRTDDAYVVVNLRDVNPYADGDRAVYLDANNDVWFGYLVE